MRDEKLPKHVARRLIGQVDHEIQDIKRKQGLPLAVSAEGLHDCPEIEIAFGAGKERRS